MVPSLAVILDWLRFHGLEKKSPTKHAILVTAGRLHNLRNIGHGDLKLFAVFSPPSSGASAIVHKAGAEAAEEQLRYAWNSSSTHKANTNLDARPEEVISALRCQFVDSPVAQSPVMESTWMRKKSVAIESSPNLS